MSASPRSEPKRADHGRGDSVDFSFQPTPAGQHVAAVGLLMPAWSPDRLKCLTAWLTYAELSVDSRFPQGAVQCGARRGRTDDHP